MAGKGKVEGCASCAKWLLIIFNVLFCLIGVALIAAGVYAYIELRDYLNILGDKRVSAPAIVLIVFGCITFIIAAIGCVGACKESPCLLFTFATIIAILLISELAVGIAAFVYRGEIEGWFDNNAAKFMSGYNESNMNSVETDAWNVLMKKAECCGISGADDWKNTTIAKKQNGKVPDVCTENSLTKGCKMVVIDLIKSRIGVVAGVAIAFAVIQIFGIVLACCVGCSARKGEMA